MPTYQELVNKYWGGKASNVTAAIKRQNTTPAAVKSNDSGITTASDSKKAAAYKPEDNPIVRALGAANGMYNTTPEDTITDKVVKGAAQSTASSFVNLFGTLSGGTGELTMGQSAQAAANGQKQQTLEAGKKQRQDTATKQRLYNKADELQAKSEKNIASAKEGLGKVGQTLVDVGVAGTQMLGDAVLNLAAPGAGLIGMGLRSFGSGAQEQRQKGGTETDMLLGGLKSAAIEVFTERLGGFYGKSKLSGVIDDAIKSIGKSGAVPALLTLVKNGAEEAVEEILSDIFNPLADRVLDLDSKRGSGEKIGVFSEDNVKTMIHDGIVGGVLGLVGGGSQILLNSAASTQTAQDAAETPTAEAQQTTPTAEANAVTEAQEKLNSALQNDEAQPQTNPVVEAVRYAEEQNSAEQQTAEQSQSAPLTAERAAEITQTIQQVVEGARVADPNATVDDVLDDMQANPADYGVTEAEITRYIDDGLGAANIGFTGEFETKTSQYRTNTMERIFAPEDISDDGFEVESGNFDYTVKPEEYTSAEGQRLYDYHMASGGIRNVVDTLMRTQEWTAEISEMATIAQKDLTAQEMAALNDPNTTKEEYDALKAARLEIARLKQEHITNAAQVLQAEVKWSRSDDATTVWDEAEQTLDENETLSDAEKQAKLKSLSKWLMDIEGVDENSLNANGDLKAIIKDIANERGTTRNFAFNKKRAVIADRIIDWSLDRLSFAELQRLALESAKASVTDTTDRANFGQRLKTAQILFLLSKPKTPAINVSGNFVMSGVDAMSMNGAALADMMLAQITGTRSVAGDKWIFSKQAWRGLADASSKSIAEIMLDVDMGGKGRYGGPVRTNKMTRPTKERQSIIGKAADGLAGVTERAFSVWERNNALAMVATDEAFKGAVRGSTEAQLNKLAAEGKIKADENYVRNQANELARERTFQQNSGLAEFISSAHDYLNTIVGIGKTGKTFAGKEVKAFGFGDIVAPFTKVAGNIVSTAYNYSVANAVKGFTEICEVARDAKNGSVNAEAQARAVKDFSRGVNGTVLAALCYIAAKYGFLKRADDEDDPDVAALNAAEGMAGTQFNITAFNRMFATGDTEWKYGDKLLDVSSLEPLNTFMAVGTVAASWGEDDTFIGKAIEAEDAMFESTLELPILSFINSVLQDTRYGDSFAEAVNKELLESATGMLVPNFIRGIAQGTDKYYRDTYSGETELENIGNAIKNGIPSANKTLPIKLTPFGENKTRSGTALGIFLNSVINPIGVNTYLQSDVSAELQSVREATGRVNFYPDKSAPNSITENKVKYDLTYDEKQKYMKAAGEYYQRVGNSIIQSKEYKSMDDETKAEVLNRLRSESAAVAKSVVMSGRGAGEKEKGLSASEIVDKVAYSAATNGGGDSIADRVTALNNGYSEQKIYDMWVNDDGEAVEQRDKFDAMNDSLSADDKVSLKTYLPIYQYKESLRRPDDVKDQYYCKKQFRSYLQDAVNSRQLSAEQANAIFLSFYKDFKNST